MTQAGGDSPVRRMAALDLGEDLAAALRAQLVHVAEATIPAVIAEVPGYRGAFGAREQENLARAVTLALRGLVNVAARGAGAEGAPLGPALAGAYDLGRGEARAGRSMEALLAAYRVGARVSWRELADLAVANGMTAGQLVSFAELVFAYIDELSAASVAGHADELARLGRNLRMTLDQLGRDLLAGAPVESLGALAQSAMWAPPPALVAVLVGAPQARRVLARVDLATLEVTGDLPGLASSDDVAALLVPIPDPQARQRLLTSLGDIPGVVGPARPWLAVRASAVRAARAWRLRLGPDLVDTEANLPELAVTADPDVLADLRARVLAPLSGLRPAVAARLEETLRAWLLHQGRREEVAAQLFVHPQTVRYRMGQIRELFGSGLEDPRTHLELMIALAADPAGDRGSGQPVD